MQSLEADDVFALRFVRDGRLAPDGRSVAIIVSSTEELEDSAEIWLIDLETGAQRTVGPAVSRWSGIRWAPGGTALCAVEHGPGGPRLMLIPANGAAPRQLSPTDRVVASAPSWAPDGSAVAVATHAVRDASHRVLTTHRRVFRTDGAGLGEPEPTGIDLIRIDDGSTRTLVPPTEEYRCSEPRWSPRGDAVLFLTDGDVDASLPFFSKPRVANVATGEVHDLLGRWGGCQAAQWRPDGSGIVFVGARGGKRAIPNMELWSMPTSGEPEARTPHIEAHVGCRAVHDMPIWDLTLAGGLAVGSDGAAYATVQRGGAAEVWRIPLDGPTRPEPVVTGDRTALVLDHHPQAGVLFITSDILRPTEVSLLRPDGAEHRLTHLNDEVLAGWPQLEWRHTSFPAHDGLELEAWCVAAAGSEGPQPTVLNIHQGPYTTAGHAFRFDIHLLASHGMAVAYSNFRGSTGYGQRFMDGMGGNWGESGFPDHMAAADAIVAKGWADPDRMGVWGASHGGYATAWCVGHTGRFAAAMAEAGLTDMTAAYYLSDIPEVWATMLGGRPDEVPDAYRAASPLTFAGACTTPILLFHCELDARSPLDQSAAFHRAVLDAGGVSELVVVRGGDHIADSTGRPWIRLAQNAALVRWFEQALVRR